MAHRPGSLAEIQWWSSKVSLCQARELSKQSIKIFLLLIPNSLSYDADVQICPRPYPIISYLRDAMFTNFALPLGVVTAWITFKLKEIMPLIRSTY